MKFIEADVPWDRIVIFLNDLISSVNFRNDNMRFPHSPEMNRPLPEDYARQGLRCGQEYVPQRYLQEANLDIDEYMVEAASMAVTRKERILCLACKIASVSCPLYSTPPLLIQRFSLLQENQYLEHEPSSPCFRVTNHARRLTHREVLDVPDITDMISDAESDVSSIQDSEGV